MNKNSHKPLFYLHANTDISQEPDTGKQNMFTYYVKFILGAYYMYTTGMYRQYS